MNKKIIIKILQVKYNLYDIEDFLLWSYGFLDGLQLINIISWADKAEIEHIIQECKVTSRHFRSIVKK